MTRFSASDAALEGFQVIRRHWRVVAGWAAFNVVALVAMVVLTVLVLLLTIAVAGTETEGTAGVAGGVIWLAGSLLAQAVVVGGLFRLLLQPEAPGFLHLRIGRDEIRLLAIWLISLAAVFLAIGVAAALSQVAGAGGGLATGLVAAVALIYLALRFSLVTPISFAEGRIDFAGSWRLTRGRALAILGMALISGCLIAIVVILAWLALLLVVGLATGFGGMAELVGGSLAIEGRPGLYLLNLAAQILFAPVLWVLSQAPLAAAYRALRAAPGEAAA